MATQSVKTLRSLAADARLAGDYATAIKYAEAAMAQGTLSQARKGDSEMQWSQNEILEFIKLMEKRLTQEQRSASKTGGFQRTKFVYERPSCE